MYTNANDDLANKSLPRVALQMARWVLKPGKELNGYHIAEATLNIEQDRAVAKVRLRALREMLEEAEQYLDQEQG